MTRDYAGLLSPRSVALLGDPDWMGAVIRSLRNMGYVWNIWPVTSEARQMEHLECYPQAQDLPSAPDLAFFGPGWARTFADGDGGAQPHSDSVDSTDTDAQLADALQAFATRGTTAAIITTTVEDAAALRRAAAPMILLGAGSAGQVNALDRAALWPESHGATPVKRGVAVLGQSETALKTLSEQTRGLSLAYMAHVGDERLGSMIGLGAALLRDERITVLGLQSRDLHRDVSGLLELGRLAARLGKSVVVLKPGRDPGTSALMARAGFGRVGDLPSLIEALKVLHLVGPLPANALAAACCCDGVGSGA